jgi:FkbM family methyltransferase
MNLYRLRWEIGVRTSPRVKRLGTRWEYLRFVVGNVNGWTRLLLWHFGIRIPFRAIFRGTVFEVKDEGSRLALSDCVRQALAGPVSLTFKDGEENGLAWITFTSHGRELNYRCRWELKDDALTLLKAIFQRKRYAALDVQGRDVLDVGANIGDSAIYFALSGARRVIGLELFPSTFEIAKLNVDANRLGDKILLLNEGAGNTGTVQVDPQLLAGRTATIAQAKNGIEVRINSLGDLINRFSLDKAALKINCEGCEYDLLFGASAADLSHFQTIMLEYHHGSGLIARRLRKAGFAVKTMNHTFSYNEHFADPRSESGYISARR